MTLKREITSKDRTIEHSEFSLKYELDRSNEKIADLTIRISKLNAEIASKTAKISKLETDVSRWQEVYERQPQSENSGQWEQLRSPRNRSIRAESL